MNTNASQQSLAVFPAHLDVLRTITGLSSSSLLCSHHGHLLQGHENIAGCAVMYEFQRCRISLFVSATLYSGSNTSSPSYICADGKWYTIYKLRWSNAYVRGRSRRGLEHLGFTCYICFICGLSCHYCHAMARDLNRRRWIDPPI